MNVGQQPQLNTEHKLSSTLWTFSHLRDTRSKGKARLEGKPRSFFLSSCHLVFVVFRVTFFNFLDVIKVIFSSWFVITSTWWEPQATFHHLNLKRTSTWWEPQATLRWSSSTCGGPALSQSLWFCPARTRSTRSTSTTSRCFCLFVNCKILVSFAISGLSSKKSNPGELEERHNHGAARRAWGRSTHQVRAEKLDLQSLN